MGLRQSIQTSHLGWHAHQRAYAALVLEGSYEEAGDCGRFRVEAGDIVFHNSFEAHVNRVFSKGAVVLNLSLPKDAAFGSGPASADDFGTIVRIAESSSRDAIEMLLFSTRQKQQSGSDWPDMLASAIVRIPNLKLSEWANQQGIAPWSLSRGFRQVFGISPEAFRARSRARNAWNRIQSTNESLADIATRFGFADQSHMSRSVKLLTGSSPGQCRTAANRFKTQHGTSFIHDE